MQITLVRTYSDEAAIGTLTVGSDSFYSIEQPWRDNLHGHSCVPEGTYSLIPYESLKHGQTWQLHNPSLNIYGTGPVPATGRSMCEIHSANWAEQLEGCIALGTTDEPMWNPIAGTVTKAVQNSREAITQFIDILGSLSSGHTLTITHGGE